MMSEEKPPSTIATVAAASNDTSSSSSAISPAQKSLEKFLNKPMRIELSDGRIIIGNLVCTDNVPNIILQGSQEYWLKDWPNGYIRDLGVVVIGGKHIKSIRVLQEDHDS